MSIQSLGGDLSILEVRAELSCSNTAIWNIINRGDLDAYKVGRVVRIPRESLADFKKRFAIGGLKRGE